MDTFMQSDSGGDGCKRDHDCDDEDDEDEGDGHSKKMYTLLLSLEYL